MQINNQVDALILFFKKMDIDMIDEILDDKIKYQDFEKYLFINKLQKAFDTFKSKGDTELFTSGGQCDLCYKCVNGLSFIGNKSNAYFDIIIKSKDDKIEDICECLEFINEDNQVVKKERIYIDDSDVDFINDVGLFDKE